MSRRFSPKKGPLTRRRKLSLSAQGIEVTYYFPAPIWVTSAAQKTRGIRSKRVVRRSSLQKVLVTEQVVVPVVVIPEVRVVSQVAYRVRSRRGGKVELIPLIKPIFKPLPLSIVTEIAVQRSAAIRKRNVGSVVLIESFGYVTAAPPIRAPKVVSLPSTRRRQARNKVTLISALGDAVVVTPIYPQAIKVVLTERNKRSKLAGTVIIVEAFGAQTYPYPIKVVAQVPAKNRKKQKLATQIITTFGYATSAPPVRAPRVLLQAVSRTILALKVRPKTQLKKVGGGEAIIWTEYGAPFLFTEANWTGPNPFFEVYMRAVVGTVYARVWDVTAGVEVPNSVISTVLNSFQRIRSVELVLTNTHEYKLQVGKIPINSGEIISGRLIII